MRLTSFRSTGYKTTSIAERCDDVFEKEFASSGTDRAGDLPPILELALRCCMRNGTPALTSPVLLSHVNHDSIHYQGPTKRKLPRTSDT